MRVFRVNINLAAVGRHVVGRPLSSLPVIYYQKVHPAGQVVDGGITRVNLLQHATLGSYCHTTTDGLLQPAKPCRAFFLGFALRERRPGGGRSHPS